MGPFEPVAFEAVTEPRQLKVFADPLRVRVLNRLKQRPATNQQVADALGEPQAKVLYHVRFLLAAGLIRLVEQRVRGGNVEKFYRATARLYGLRPGQPDAAAGLAAATLEAAVQEVSASEAAWPHQPPDWETRRAQLSPEREAEFLDRFRALVAEYWGGPAGTADATADATGAVEDPGAPWRCFAAVLYRDPAAPAAAEQDRAEPSPATKGQDAADSAPAERSPADRAS